jgi:hypothetical protein
MTIISSTIWDSGSTTWDSGNSLWDPHRRIDGTVDNLTLSNFGSSVIRPPINATTATLILIESVAKVTRTINSITTPLMLAANDAVVIRPPIDATIGTLGLSESVAKVTRTTNVSIDAVLLNEYDIDLYYSRQITVNNLPSLVITKRDTKVTFTTRNLTFFLSPVF